MLNHLENECLSYLATQNVTTDTLRPLIEKFLRNQPEHVLLILAKKEQQNDAISTTLAHSKNYKPDILIDRAISHLTDILYKEIKAYYFQTKC